MLEKQLSEKPTQKEEVSTEVAGARETILPLLKGRALEVLRTAEAQYPQATTQIEDELARLIKEEKIKGPISGEALYTLFRRIGLRVRLKTKIVYIEDGKEKSLSEKLKGE